MRSDMNKVDKIAIAKAMQCERFDEMRMEKTKKCCSEGNRNRGMAQV